MLSQIKIIVFSTIKKCVNWRIKKSINYSIIVLKVLMYIGVQNERKIWRVFALGIPELYLCFLEGDNKIFLLREEMISTQPAFTCLKLTIETLNIFCNVFIDICFYVYNEEQNSNIYLMRYIKEHLIPLQPLQSRDDFHSSKKLLEGYFFSITHPLTSLRKMFEFFVY